jgi:hypothetical protein
MARRVAYLTFQPSVYSTGVRFPSRGLTAAGVYRDAAEEDEEYGFIVSGPLLLGTWALKKAGMAAAEAKMKDVVKEFWWAYGLMGLGVYYGMKKYKERQDLT